MCSTIFDFYVWYFIKRVTKILKNSTLYHSKSNNSLFHYSNLSFPPIIPILIYNLCYHKLISSATWSYLSITTSFRLHFQARLSERGRLYPVVHASREKNIRNDREQQRKIRPRKFSPFLLFFLSFPFHDAKGSQRILGIPLFNDRAEVEIRGLLSCFVSAFNIGPFRYIPIYRGSGQTVIEDNAKRL